MPLTRVDLASNATDRSDPPPPNEWNNSLVIGLFVVGLIGLISSLMASGLFLYLARDTVKNIRNRNRSSSAREKLRPISMVFMLAMFMDIFQGLGSVFDMYWAVRGKVVDVGPNDPSNSICTTQAVMQQFGNDGAAWCTIWIAILTLWKPANSNRWGLITLAIITQVSIFILLMIVIPATTLKAYYGNTGVWCWIQFNDGVKGSHGPTRDRLRIASEYAVFWAAVLISFVCYGLAIWKWRTEKTKTREEYEDRQTRAKATVWWPIAYALQILPISIVRWINFRRPKHPVHNGGVVAVGAIFALSGVVNVTLWLVTGRRFGFTRDEVKKTIPVHGYEMNPLDKATPQSEPQPYNSTTATTNGASGGRREFDGIGHSRAL